MTPTDPTKPSPATRRPRMLLRTASAGIFLLASGTAAQTTGDPFPAPIETEEGVIVAGVVEFATVPEVGGEPPRLMTLAAEPGSDRLVVSEMRGLLYRIGPEGSPVTEYLDLREERWGVDVESSGRERGVQGLALHPRFGDPGAAGFGRFYTWTDVGDTAPDPDYAAGGEDVSHHTVLHEWRARDPEASAYDGGPPRELLRLEQPFGNHNGGAIAFDPLASPGDADFGLLYVGSADGGSGGDPLDLAQDPGSAFGKILRVDPLGTDGPTGAYGIPPENPYAGEASPGVLGEIYARGVRNPQHFAWDPASGAMYVADIGQNMVEEVSPVTRGADLGWNVWEGSFRFVSRRAVRADDPRSDPDVTYPVAEYDHEDPLVGPRAAVTGLHVHRSGTVPELTGRVLFGDLPSGEIFHFDADDPPEGGSDDLRRVLLDAGGGPRTLLELVRRKNQEQGRAPARRTDLRIFADRDGRIFLLNKHDATIRLLVPRSRVPSG